MWSSHSLSEKTLTNEKADVLEMKVNAPAGMRRKIFPFFGYM
jgi:hypothetical protein